MFRILSLESLSKGFKRRGKNAAIIAMYKMHAGINKQRSGKLSKTFSIENQMKYFQPLVENYANRSPSHSLYKPTCALCVREREMDENKISENAFSSSTATRPE